MKILIQNYTNSVSSKPIYLDHAVKTSRCGETFLWSPRKMSVYDVMDGFQPDVALVKYDAMSRDLIKYLVQAKPVPTFIDITGAAAHIVGMIEQQIAQLNMPVKGFISETPKTLRNFETKIPTADIMPGADVFLGKSDVPNFKLDGAVVGRIQTKTFDDCCNRFKTYHKVLVRDQKGQGNRAGFDIEGSVMFLKSVYDKYKEIVLNGDLSFVLSQIFFDATISSEKVSLSYPQEQQGLFSDSLESIFEDTGEEPSLKGIKSQILENHTCIDRCSEILKYLGDTEASETVLKLKEGL